MRNLASLAVLLIPPACTRTSVLGFVSPSPTSYGPVVLSLENSGGYRLTPARAVAHRRSSCELAAADDDADPIQRRSERGRATEAATAREENYRGSRLEAAWFPWLFLLPALLPLPAEAAAGAVPSALWAYAHYFSIIAIFGCLAAERTIVGAGMTEEDEDTIVKLDLIYGLMAALLIGSGFARATTYGKGSDFYLNESLFWVKMSFSGIWGGLSLFPSVTFYKRNFARKANEVVPPVSEKLAKRLQQVINAEITAVLSIPLLATLMSRGVGYWQDFPWQIGLVVSILATVGSFYFYARQAFTWTEDDGVVLED